MKHHSLASHLPEKPQQENQAPKSFLTKNPGLNAFLEEGKSKNGLVAADLKPVTKTIQKCHRNKRRYINTPNRVRIELIDAVHKHGEKIKQAAKRLGINYSSAKAICQVYKREGRSDKIIVKKRVPKPGLKSLKQDKYILTKTFDCKLEEKILIKEKALLNTYENFKKEAFTEDQKVFHKVEKYFDSEKCDTRIFKGISSPSTLYPSLQEAKQGSHIINQNINQNNIFLTVQSNYLPQAQKLNVLPPEKSLLANLQSVAKATTFGFPNAQAQQELLARIMNSSVSQQNVKQEPVKYNQQYLVENLEKQFMQPYQDQFKQSIPCYLIRNFRSGDPIVSPFNQFDLSSMQKDDYGLINPSLSLLSKGFDARLSSLPAVAPNFNGYIQNMIHGQGIYYPKP